MHDANAKNRRGNIPPITPYNMRGGMITSILFRERIIEVKDTPFENFDEIKTLCESFMTAQELVDSIAVQITEHEAQIKQLQEQIAPAHATLEEARKAFEAIIVKKPVIKPPEESHEKEHTKAQAGKAATTEERKTIAPEVKEKPPEDKTAEAWMEEVFDNVVEELKKKKSIENISEINIIVSKQGVPDTKCNEVSKLVVQKLRDMGALEDKSVNALVSGIVDKITKKKGGKKAKKE